MAVAAAAPLDQPTEAEADTKAKPKRKPLPDHLPRVEQVLSVGDACTDCGGALRELGRDTTDELEYVPGRFVVNQIIRPRMACKVCGCINQAPLAFTPDRKGIRPSQHLKDYQGWMHADGYAGFEDLYRSGQIKEVACMAHIRRKFVDVFKSQGSHVAEQAIQRIAELYAVEKEARGSPPERRVT